MAKDRRSKEEKAQWEAGRFTEEEAAEIGTTADELNRQRTEGARETGDPTAPPAD